MLRTVSLDLEEGQTVWFQGSLGYVVCEEVKVEKVGRLWATLSNGYRCNRHTGEADGGHYSSPGMVYRSQEEYEKTKALQAMWRRLQHDIANKHVLREDLNRRNILTVRKLLKLDT